MCQLVATPPVVLAVGVTSQLLGESLGSRAILTGGKNTPPTVSASWVARVNGPSAQDCRKSRAVGTVSHRTKQRVNL